MLTSTISMIKFHEAHKSKNTKKYLNKVISRNSYNDNYFLEASKEFCQCLKLKYFLSHYTAKFHNARKSNEKRRNSSSF